MPGSREAPQSVEQLAARLRAAVTAWEDALALWILPERPPAVEHSSAPGRTTDSARLWAQVERELATLAEERDTLRAALRVAEASLRQREGHLRAAIQHGDTGEAKTVLADLEKLAEHATAVVADECVVTALLEEYGAELERQRVSGARFAAGE